MHGVSNHTMTSSLLTWVIADVGSAVILSGVPHTGWKPATCSPAWCVQNDWLHRHYISQKCNAGVCAFCGLGLAGDDEATAAGVMD